MFDLLPFDPSEPPEALRPGLYRMGEASYHADPCEPPSLNATTLKVLVQETPLHAYHQHPRLGGVPKPTTRAMDMGSAVHALALGFPETVACLPYDSYRTAEAKQAKEDAGRAGLIPLLAAEHARAEATAARLRASAERFLGLPMGACLREFVMVWQDAGSGLWRRAKVDAATPDLRRFLDLKSTEKSIGPQAIARRVGDDGLAIQQAHYLAGADALDPAGRGRRRFAFVFGETNAPYATAAYELTESWQDLGRQQVATGSRLWDACLARDAWPGYDPEPVDLEAPAWAIAAWEARAATDRTLNPPTNQPAANEAA